MKGGHVLAPRTDDSNSGVGVFFVCTAEVQRENRTPHEADESVAAAA